MEQDLEDLQLIDLGDAKEMTKGPFTMVIDEDNLQMNRKPLP